MPRKKSMAKAAAGNGKRAGLVEQLLTAGQDQLTEIEEAKARIASQIAEPLPGG